MNYPWSGKIHPEPHSICLWCGDKVPDHSSISHKCFNCNSTKEPLPHLIKILEESNEKEARKYCETNGLDYNKEIIKGELSKKIEDVAWEARDQNQKSLSRILFTLMEALTYDKEDELWKLVKKFDEDILGNPRGYRII